MELTLAEELLLLGLDDQTGEVILSVSTALPFGLAGALLLDLFNSNRIEIRDDKVFVIDSTPTGNNLLDEALNLLSKSDKPEKVSYWIKHLNSSIDDMFEKIINELVSKGILKRQEKKILWIIPVERFPTNDPIPEVLSRIGIRRIVLENEEPDNRTVALLSLIKASNLIDELFLKDERRQAANIIDDYIKNEKIGKVVSDINNEVTAIIASSVAGSVAAASVVGNI
jgi:hypothetical protein